jgi:hypothetical protein
LCQAFSYSWAIFKFISICPFLLSFCQVSIQAKQVLNNLTDFNQSQSISTHPKGFFIFPRKSYIFGLNLISLLINFNKSFYLIKKVRKHTN